MRAYTLSEPTVRKVARLVKAPAGQIAGSEPTAHGGPVPIWPHRTGKIYGALPRRASVDVPTRGEMIFDSLNLETGVFGEPETAEPTEIWNTTDVDFEDGERAIAKPDTTALNGESRELVWLVEKGSGVGAPPRDFVAGYMAGVYPISFGHGGSQWRLIERNRWFWFEHTFWYAEQFEHWRHPVLNSIEAIKVPRTSWYEIDYKFGYELSTAQGVETKELRPTCEVYYGRTPGIRGQYPNMSSIINSDAAMPAKFITVNDPAATYKLGGRVAVRFNTFLEAGDYLQLWLDAQEDISGSEDFRMAFDAVNFRVRLTAESGVGGEPNP